MSKLSYDIYMLDVHRNILFFKSCDDYIPHFQNIFEAQTPHDFFTPDFIVNYKIHLF